jgi:transposase
MMASIYAAREWPPPQDLRQRNSEQLLALWRLCREHADSEHAKTRALVRELLNAWESFWIVLDDPHLPLANNVAERALRLWVIARRIGYGTRNAQGSRSVAVLASVIETCR